MAKVLLFSDMCNNIGKFLIYFRIIYKKERPVKVALLVPKFDYFGLAARHAR